MESILKRDGYLAPYLGFFRNYRERVRSLERMLTGESIGLPEFATAHKHFGLHVEEGRWVIREWAPNACKIYLVGSFNNWERREEFALQRQAYGVWQLEMPRETLKHYDLYKLVVCWHGGEGDRIPAYCRRVVQDQVTHIFNAQVWDPPEPYRWHCPDIEPLEGQDPLFIYESHVGMAQEKHGVGSYLEFAEHTLPWIKRAGYNAVQLMAVMEHPYYGSFGYQVSNFFAPSFRFGTPEELKYLIDKAHQMGLRVFLDLVHSHAVRNEVEGLSRFDGTYYQYFHDGGRGSHPVWDSRLFNYGKPEVLQFLLSNIRYWLEEYKFDGFRFDGVTRMLYYDHGLGGPFVNYDCYFGSNLDLDSLVYLTLANKVAHAVRPCTTIAEDVSGLPMLAAPVEEGGAGFDCRLAMGIPDFWVHSIKKKRDEDWNVSHMFHALTDRRSDERTISYAESHDQALVGDQTHIYRLLRDRMYDSMRIDQENHEVHRGLALHRMIRLITVALADKGYLNFMGNEWGHPEWIDFPRPGNNWSFHHARRLWSLVHNGELQYQRLAEFDRQMLAFVNEVGLLRHPWAVKLQEHVADQILVFSRGESVFIFNFNPFQSFDGYQIHIPVGSYRLAFDTDRREFGGHERLAPGQVYHPQILSNGAKSVSCLKVYLPTRTGLILRPEALEESSEEAE